MGERLVQAPGRKAIVHGGMSQIFTPESAEYVRELGGGDIPIIAVAAARHHLMLDQHLAFVTALRSILALWDTPTAPPLADRKSTRLNSSNYCATRMPSSY